MKHHVVPVKVYFTIFGALMSALSVGVALGPLTAGAFFDYFGGYNQFLLLTSVAMVLSALALLTINRDGPGADFGHASH